jgi:glycyl-tRNA synthetase alpha subunit
MISFFRKIRQKLLQQNQVTRYLVYALGEIALVMIGILLALQVNNWNEDRKNNIKISEYKEGLIEDYNKDIARIDTILRSFNQSEAQHQNFTERLSHPQASFDTLVKIAKYEFLGYFDNIDAFNTATFQTLISTGDISLFPKKIRRKLIEINNQQQ